MSITNSKREKKIKEYGWSENSQSQFFQFAEQIIGEDFLLPKTSQKMLFSATLPESLIRFTKLAMRDPLFLRLDERGISYKHLNTYPQSISHKLPTLTFT